MKWIEMVCFDGFSLMQSICHMSLEDVRASGRRIGSPAGGARLSARRVGVDAAAGGDGAG